MLAEFKRDSARKELEKVMTDIASRKHHLREMDEKEQTEENKIKTQQEQQVCRCW